MAHYNNMTEFRDDILRYLQEEKQFTQEDIDQNNDLPDNEKVEKGLLIESASLTSSLPPFYDLSLSENNTKLRPGDKVKFVRGSRKFDVIVVENTEFVLSVNSSEPLDSSAPYRVEVCECVLLDPLIALAERIEEGANGSFWMEMLAGLEKPDKEGYRPLNITAVKGIPPTFNTAQYECCRQALLKPTFHCIQGPPGTGKTDVLATIANAYSSAGGEVLVLSNTHQAVNNALNKINTVNKSLKVVKIGEELKGDGLHSDIIKATTYNEYLATRKKSKRRGANNDVVGMTYQAAVINLGLRTTTFQPSLILVDEAGQMPLVQGALIGSFGSGTVIFIGDDLQMPPIYHQKLSQDPLSVSIFTHLCTQYPDFRTALTTTYRMNDDITRMVSARYYQPHGITLTASDFSKDRILQVDSKSSNSTIKELLSSSQSIHSINVSQDDTWRDENSEEAEFIAELVKDAIDSGMSAHDLAVITPYRRQVKTIRQHVLNAMGKGCDLPLVDTVERLQGQDVDLIIISLSITDDSYWQEQKSFIMNPNRLNVMFSRAKKKIIVVGKQSVI